MSYERVRYGTDPDSIAAREKAVASAIGENKPNRKWLDELKARHEAGKILLPIQLEHLRRNGL